MLEQRADLKPVSPYIFILKTQIMTNAKIMLSAVAAVAAVSGAFALKSKKIGVTPLYTIHEFKINGPQSCDRFLTDGSINTLSPLSFYYYVTIAVPVSGDGANCTLKYFTVNQ